MGTPTLPHRSAPIGWHAKAHHPGHSLAVLSTAMLVTDGILMLGAAAWAIVAAQQTGDPLALMMNRSAFPVMLYMIWALGVFGSAGAICAIALYGYRERWFWRWLVAASLVWLISPPAHMVIGLVSFIVLIRLRDHFPKSPARTT